MADPYDVPFGHNACFTVKQPDRQADKRTVGAIVSTNSQKIKIVHCVSQKIQRRSGNLNGHLMVSYVGNIRTKNC